MEKIILPSYFGGKVEAPPSKSFMHRVFICAAAADKPTVIACNAFSEDTKATMRTLAALGADFKIEESKVTVTPIKTKTSEKCLLDCGESGSTLRFMLPFAAATGKECVFNGAERLGQRPLLPLCEAMMAHGVNISLPENASLPCEIKGQLTGGEFEIPAFVSSQFISGLLMALPLVGGGRIRTTGELKSAGYIDITLDVMNRFGVTAQKTEYGYFVPDIKYKSPEALSSEGDWSNAAFWLVGGAIASEDGITCTGLSENSFQGDKEILSVLERMGAESGRHKNFVTVKKSKLYGIEIDAEHICDLVPVLCVAASAAEGVTVIKNTARLRDKESDRVKTTCDMINSLGGRAESDENSITVYGVGRLSGGIVDSANDHRIAMSGAIASLICENPVKISGAESVSKSYPDFFEKFEVLQERK